MRIPLYGVLPVELEWRVTIEICGRTGLLIKVLYVESVMGF